jgi:hypothetical protein
MASNTLHLSDPDLHAWLLGAEVNADIALLARGVAAVLGPGRIDEAWWQQRHGGYDPAAVDVRPTLEAIYRAAPRNLAERLHEGLNIYWAVGQRALPPLLPLLNPMVQAELHLYTKLDLSGKPYREHIVHTTRVAAMAHLFLADPAAVHLPAELSWERIRSTWSHSREFHLLRRFAVERGLNIPDPAEPGDPWRPWVRVAALLAGLMHDLGYLHKAIGEVTEKSAQAVPWMSFVPKVGIDDPPEWTPLGGFYRTVFEATEHGQVYAPLPEFLRRNYRPLHSVVGALWLARLAEELRPATPGAAPDPSCHEEASMAELTFQLAALFAFAHDLSLSDGKRRKLLGMRQVERGGEKLDVVNRHDFPLCTLFSLADVLQEFGRPIQVVDGDALRYWVPVAGIGLEPEGSGLRVRYLSGKPGKATSLLPKAAVDGRAVGAWEERFVGTGVESWLKSSGLDPLVLVHDGTEPADLKQRLASYDRDQGPSFGHRKLLTSQRLR